MKEMQAKASQKGPLGMLKTYHCCYGSVEIALKDNVCLYQPAALKELPLEILQI